MKALSKRTYRNAPPKQRIPPQTPTLPASTSPICSSSRHPGHLPPSNLPINVIPAKADASGATDAVNPGNTTNRAAYPRWREHPRKGRKTPMRPHPASTTRKTFTQTPSATRPTAPSRERSRKPGTLWVVGCSASDHPGRLSLASHLPPQRAPTPAHPAELVLHHSYFVLRPPMGCTGAPHPLHYETRQSRHNAYAGPLMHTSRLNPPSCTYRHIID